MKIYVDIEKTLTDNIYLVGADNWYEFVGGKRTDKLLGARARIVLVKNEFEKVNVKIPGKTVAEIQKLVDKSGGKFVSVHLVEPEGTVYMFNNRLGISITAKDIEVVE